MIGIIEQFDREKRYGFINGDDGRRYFVHESSINVPSKFLDRGNEVSFIATINDHGYAAERVCPL